MIRIKINYDKIDTKLLFQGKTGRMLDVTLVDRKDDYGNDFMAVQDVGKERRLAGEKGPILGNGKTIETVKPTRAPQQEERGEVSTFMKPSAGGASGVNAPASLDEDVPF